jgi:hypothetical protein
MDPLFYIDMLFNLGGFLYPTWLEELLFFGCSLCLGLAG